MILSSPSITARPDSVPPSPAPAGDFFFSTPDEGLILVYTINSYMITPKGFYKSLLAHSEPVHHVEESTKAFLWTKHRSLALTVRVLAWSSSALIFIIGLVLFPPAQGGDPGLITFIAALPLLAPASLYIITRNTMRRHFYSRIATQLGATYIPQGVVPTEGRLFSFGDRKELRHLLQGREGSPVSWVGEYKCELGSGKNRHVDTYTVAAIRFPAPLPRILCVPADWSLGMITSWQPSGFSPLRINADFSAKFNVYVPPDGEMEAFQILEPDVMAALIDSFHEYGFECVGSTLYVFTQASLQENQDAISHMLLIIKRLRELLVPEILPLTR
jgi:hypothetical protein